jgi:hypothetical protein
MPAIKKSHSRIDASACRACARVSLPAPSPASLIFCSWQAADVIKWLSKEWVNAKCNPENKPTLLEKVKAVQKAMAQCYNNTAIALSKMSGCPFPAVNVRDGLRDRNSHPRMATTALLDHPSHRALALTHEATPFPSFVHRETRRGDRGGDKGVEFTPPK